MILPTLYRISPSSIRIDDTVLHELANDLEEGRLGEFRENGHDCLLGNAPVIPHLHGGCENPIP